MTRFGSIALLCVLGAAACDKAPRATMLRVEKGRSEKLADGVGLLAWADRADSARAKYPSGEYRRSFAGRNPQTGEIIDVAPMMTIPEFEAAGALGQVSFDQAGISEIYMFGGADGPAVAAALGARYGFGPIDTELAEQVFHKDGVEVMVFLEPKDYAVRFRRPGYNPPELAPPPAGGRECFAVGRRIMHADLGAGTVRRVAGDKVLVDFDLAGTKTMLDRFLRCP